MAVQQSCSIDSIMQFLDSRQLTVAQMIQIENHIAAGDCPKVHPPLKDLATKVVYLKSFTNTSPLLLHCYMGDLRIVKRMIEVWGADIESRSYLSITGEISIWMGLNLTLSPDLKDVTPLFAAALNNNTTFVRYLVDKGADVSATTSTLNRGPFGGLTPLHGALLHGRLVHQLSDQVDIVRILLEAGADPSALSSNGTPTWMCGCLSYYGFWNAVHFLHRGHCNVKAITLLVEHGMRIDQLCPRLGRTLLHHMAGPANSVDDEKIVKLLLEKGADPKVRDKNGLTPIMTAAIGTNLLPNMFILKFLLERDDIPNMDKIEAAEVALAVLLSYDTNLVHTHDINYCLSRAQDLRNIEGITLVPKTPTNGRAVEWATSSSIEQILLRPLELGMQSILIRLRIFSAMSWFTVSQYLCPFVIQEYCRKLTQQHRFAQLLDVSWTMLETVRHFAPTVDKQQFHNVMTNIIETLVNTLAELKRTDDPLFNVETLKASFELASFPFQNFFFRYDCGSMVCNHKTLRKMISILAGLPDVTIQPIAGYLSEIVGQNNEASNQKKLILVACMEQTGSTVDIVRFLLKFGTVADAVDSAGNGPLHILAKSNGEFTESIARVLLDAGAHLDRANKEGSTAADIWMEERERENKRRRREDQQPDDGLRDLPDWLREDVPKLQCLSARIIRSRGIFYKDVLPVTLHPFVAMH